MQILIIHMLLKKKRKKMRQSPRRAAAGAAGPCLSCSDTTAGCPSHQAHPEHPNPGAGHPSFCSLPPCNHLLQMQNFTHTSHHLQAPRLAVCSASSPTGTPNPVGCHGAGGAGAGLGPVPVPPIRSPVPLEQHLSVESGLLCPLGHPTATSHKGPSSITHTPGAPRAWGGWSAPALLEQNRL